MIPIKKNLQTILVIAGIFFITACKKDQNAVPNITGTNILSGLPNSAITITGNFFDTKLSDYTVTINGTPTIVNSVNASKLVVTVPAKVTAGKIIITVGSATLTYPSAFKPITETFTTSAYNTPQLQSVSADAAGNIYGNYNNIIYKITPAGVTTTFATLNPGAGNFLAGNLVSDVAGNVFVVYYTSGSTNTVVSAGIYEITPNGAVSILAGGGTPGTADGVGQAAQFMSPTGIAIDRFGNLYVNDAHRVREVNRFGLVNTIAGNGTAGAINGAASSATFGTLTAGIAVDTLGNVFVNDGNIREISATRTVTTFLNNNYNFTGTEMAVDVNDNIFLACNGTGGITSPKVIYMINTAGAASPVYTAGPFGGIVNIDQSGVMHIASGDQTNGWLVTGIFK